MSKFQSLGNKHRNCDDILTPEKLFINRISTLIRNLLINNPNYEGKYGAERSKFDLLQDTKERANYILEEIENTKHLIEK